MPDPALTGACLCGGVRFAIDAPLTRASYCHCTRCQRRSGTAASAQGFPEPGTFRFTQGEELVREWSPEEGFVKAFCGACGSALYSRAPDGDHPASVRLGVIDGDPGVRPQWRQFVAFAAPWEPIPDDGLPRHDERPS